MLESKKKIGEIAALWAADKELYVKSSTMAAYMLIMKNHIIPQFGEMTHVAEDDVQTFVLEKLKQGLCQKR